MPWKNGSLRLERYARVAALEDGERDECVFLCVQKEDRNETYIDIASCGGGDVGGGDAGGARHCGDA